MKKLLLGLITISLMACVNSNDRTFQGKSYELNSAELSQGHALYTYLPYDRSGVPHNLFVERQKLPANQVGLYAEDWYKKEQGFRKNDCQLQFKTYQNIKYATCDFNSGIKHVIYVLTTKEDQGFAKVYMSAQKITENDEHRLVQELDKFYP